MLRKLYEILGTEPKSSAGKASTCCTIASPSTYLIFSSLFWPHLAISKKLLLAVYWGWICEVGDNALLGIKSAAFEPLPFFEVFILATKLEFLKYILFIMVNRSLKLIHVENKKYFCPPPIFLGQCCLYLVVGKNQWLEKGREKMDSLCWPRLLTMLLTSTQILWFGEWNCCSRF